ncbi:hypothetical protein ACFW9U_23135 [Rhodococcus aetherivorans]|uniref:hypothetical protein n=1 Tax=Rhodococcus aetherivorans TaxID=191292 RepID=UPI00366D79C8
MRFFPDGEHRHRFLAALRAAGLEVEELWLRYFALGGEAGRVEIEAYLNGLLPLPALQHDLLAHAINERLDELAPPRAPYATELPPTLGARTGAPGAHRTEDASTSRHEPDGRDEPGGGDETGGGDPVHEHDDEAGDDPGGGEGEGTDSGR